MVSPRYSRSLRRKRTPGQDSASTRRFTKWLRQQRDHFQGRKDPLALFSRALAEDALGFEGLHGARGCRKTDLETFGDVSDREYGHADQGFQEALAGRALARCELGRPGLGKVQELRPAGFHLAIGLSE